MPRTASSSAISPTLPGIDSFINREIGQRYLVRELRGAGAHARVYRATDSVRGADVALKIFNPSALDAQVAEAARQFEVWEGTSILPLLEVHPEYLEGEVTVMPLMPQTLADVDPIFASEAIHYTRRILTALEFCHGRNVIHGDVKPSNVFIDAREAAFLGDFGVRDFLPGALRGHTLEYAAPELIAGLGRSPASDVWAAAVTLYELLTGDLPFGSRANEAEEDIADRITRGEYRHPDEIRPYLPQRVRNFFRSCFDPDLATRRVASPDGMRRALPALEIHAEWIQWSKQGYATYWEGFEVENGRRTGVHYSASVRERPRLGRWEAEVKRETPNGGLRRWHGVQPYLGTKLQAIHRMVLWMRNITGNGRP
jgi:serine/threonine protein kinase